MVAGSSLCPSANGMFPDPQSKKLYIECVGGVSAKKNCSKGLEWNHKKKACMQPGKKNIKFSNPHLRAFPKRYTLFRLLNENNIFRHSTVFEVVLGSWFLVLGC